MGKEGHLVRRILFATDFSSCANHAEEYVAFLARAYGATVDVIHVLEIYEGTYVTTIQDHRETDERLADTGRRLQQNTVNVTTQQKTGNPDVLICETATEDHADLIVLGTHGRTGLSHILLGSTAERVLTMAPCPVLTVRESKGGERQHQERPVTFEHVVVPTDFSPCSFDALEYGIQLAGDFAASLTLLHILEPVSYDPDLTFAHPAEREGQRVTVELRALAGTIRSYGISVREVVRGGLPVDSILEFIRTSDCHLIVMGTHGRRGISHVLKGSVAEGVLRRAVCPVLAMRSFPFAMDHRRLGAMRRVSSGSGI